MKYSQFFIRTLREAPSDAAVASHRLMIRAGLTRRLANGLFAYLPLGLRAFRKVEGIVREEMEAAGSLEIKPTVVVPAALWRESGRWHTMGESMLRVKNRLGDEFVVSPTAEEAVTALARGGLSSYRDLPLSLFQINTKYRDEVRPRYGVMRAREFVMKDAYSFHRDDACLDAHYRRMALAYRRIFKRCGLGVIAVKADSGAMGGEGSEEFMVESAVGDNTLLICRDCGLAANAEKASCRDDFAPPSDACRAAVPPRSKIATPAARTIAELCAFLGADAKAFIKTLIYRAANVGLDLSGAPGAADLAVRTDGGGTVYPEAFFAVCVRGDLDINEAKLAAALKASEVALASDADVVRITGAPVGFAGPVGLSGVPVVADRTVTGMGAAISGALEKDAHFADVLCGRDFAPFLVADIRAVAAGDACPACGGALYEKKGNELGHIFKLGRKYTKSMNVRYRDENGAEQIPAMGSYGIGIDRLLAGVIEEHHDDAGIVWPAPVAPFCVHVVPVAYEGAAREAAGRLYAGLLALGVETLLDDRAESAGVKFNDADMLGMPFRLTIGKKGLGQTPPQVELKRRGREGAAEFIPLDGAARAVAEMVSAELAAARDAAERLGA